MVMMVTTMRLMIVMDIMTMVNMMSDGNGDDVVDKDGSDSVVSQLDGTELWQ